MLRFTWFAKHLFMHMALLTTSSTSLDHRSHVILSTYSLLQYVASSLASVFSGPQNLG